MTRTTTRIPGALLILASAGGACTDASGPNSGVPIGAVTQLGDLVVPRALHVATALPNGLVLLTGGGTPESPLRAAELYDTE